ncbi:MAG: aldehyde dehydrogenase family protein, partial [Rhodanobacter sp.]
MTPSSDSNLTAQLQRLRNAHARDITPAWPQRAQRLRKLETMLMEQREAFVAAINTDFGQRPAEETELLEVFPSLSGVRHALRHGKRWMKPRRALAGLAFLPARNELRPQPRGVIGIIVPWNYPLLLAVGPLVDALAAGNRVMVKMSEFTPRCSALFAEQIARCFEPDEVVVVNGGADVAQAFSALAFDHLLFTGSTAVGRQVMRAAAANLTPVTLELGGKSPAIIGPGAQFDRAVERIMFGKLVNAGQTCIAPDYVLLPRAQVGDFIAGARRTVARMYPQLAHNRQYASIICDRQYQRLLALREDAQAAGAQLHPLDETSDDAARR